MNWRDVVNTSFDSKGGDLCEARNRERREMERSHVPDRSRGARMCVDPGNEHKEKPSGASTILEMKIAVRLQIMERNREGKRTWKNKEQPITLVKE